MKILHAIYSFNTGGSETMLVDIINQQCKTESVNLLIVNDKFNKSLLETIDKRTNVFLIGRKEGNKRQLLMAFWKINASLHKIRPDVIHCHDNKLFPFFITQRKKAVLTVHNTNLSCWFLKCYQKVFAVSQSVKEHVKKRANVDAQLVYNGIAIDEYQQRIEFIPAKSFKILQISRLDPKQKGQHIAVQAIAYLKEKFPNRNISLSFVGDGECETELKIFAVENKVEDTIVFLGQKSRSWIKEHLQDFDVLIQPSLYEGFGLTVIEGLAAGLPVIVSNLEGPKEILDSLNVGLTVEAGNPNDLAEKIRQIQQDYLSGNLLNTNYLIKDKKQLAAFDIQTTALRYIEQYRKLILKQRQHENPACQ